MSIAYVWYLVGPIGLLGCAVILLFYPLMVFIFCIFLIFDGFRDFVTFVFK
jgi:hypothetical protein